MSTLPSPFNEQSRLAGYAALVQRYGLATLSHWRVSAVASTSVHQTQIQDETTFELYPSRYWPGDSLGDHLAFALKYDGVNMDVLYHVFQVAERSEIEAYVGSKPTGKYARRIWYLYELLTGERLPLSDVDRGNYVDLLDPTQYYTTRPLRVRRQRVNDNLLGDARFCPVVRRTAAMQAFEDSNLPQRCQQVLAGYPPDLLRRALAYLYTKETKSSFEIERETPSADRTQRFVALLRLAEEADFFNLPVLIELQNRIVDERFREKDFRQRQNYVGETVGWTGERVHYVPPQPEDVPSIMEGMLAAHQRMAASDIHPVVHAAVISFGFVFLHPFEDGNGRIHRFLIHNILALSGFTPPGVIFPVSAVMLKDRGAYDRALEAFSLALMRLVDFTLDDEGRLTVHNETGAHYRYLDMTSQAEASFRFIAATIDTELAEELRFLQCYDAAKRAIQEIVDMPDRLIDLFIRICVQNQGTVSRSKRRNQFSMLADSELSRMEEAVRTAYELEDEGATH